MKIYLDSGALKIREMVPEDAQVIYATQASYGWHPDMNTYTGYLKEQKEGARKVFIAETDGEVSGYCTLVLHPYGGPWAGQNIPEIVDLLVFFDRHGRGIGTALLDAAEAEAARVSDTVFLAVGVHSGYGNAQRLYVRRGYIPDGSGVWYRGEVLDQYADCRNDDDLLLFLSKKLRGEEIIREIRPEEIAECVKVIRESFATVAREFGLTEENAPRFTAFATTEERLQWQLNTEHRMMYGCFDGKRLTGYYSLLKKGDACELSNLSVLPAYRHRGIGRKLMENAFENAGRSGCKRMDIGIVEENRVLRKWYEGLGFQHTGTEKYDFFPFTCGYMARETV